MTVSDRRPDHLGQTLPDRVRIVFFVASHINPPQVLRLCRRLSVEPSARVVVHHDYSVSHLDPRDLARWPNIHLLTSWTERPYGTFGSIKMILDFFHWLKAHYDYDWVYYISGQDYPIKPVSHMTQFLANTNLDAFLDCHPVIDDQDIIRDRQAFTRYYFKYITLPTFPYSHRLPLSLRRRTESWRKNFNEAQSLLQYRRLNTNSSLGIRRLKTPFSKKFICFKGSNWWTLSRRAIEYICEFSRKRPEVFDYYKNTFIPGESLLLTILMNNPALAIIGSNNLRFIRWSTGGIHPDTLSCEYLGALRSSGAHFARKLDDRIDARILDYIDAYIDGRHDL